MQWHRIWLTPSYIEYIALTTAVPFNTVHPSAVSRSRQLKAALQVFPHYKVPLTIRYSWKRLRKCRSKNLIKFAQVYIAFVLQYVHCFEKKNTYWLNESWETRLPKRLNCTITVCLPFPNQFVSLVYISYIGMGWRESCMGSQQIWWTKILHYSSWVCLGSWYRINWTVSNSQSFIKGKENPRF